MARFHSQEQDGSVSTTDCLTKGRHDCCPNGENATSCFKGMTSAGESGRMVNGVDVTYSRTSLSRSMNPNTQLNFSLQRASKISIRPCNARNSRTRASFPTLLTFFFCLITQASMVQCAQTNSAIPTTDTASLEQVISSHSSLAGSVPDAVALTGQLFLLQISPHAYSGNVTALQVSLSQLYDYIHCA